MKKIGLLICVLIIGGVGLFAATFAMLTPQGTIHKATAYKGYKTYKNKELGFSFKYPGNMYLRIVNEGFILAELTNYDPRKGVAVAQKENIFDVYLKLYDNQINKDLAPSEYLLKKLNDPSSWNIVKIIDEIPVDGGMVYLTHVKSNSYGEINKINDFYPAYLFFSSGGEISGKKKHHMLEIFPFSYSKENENKYIGILKSIKMMRK